MQIKKFRIKNYKSILDSGDGYLENNITILAGRNESGKTAILEALEDFDTEKQIREDAKPLHNPEVIPEISITFQIEKAEIEEICSAVGKTLPTKIIKTLEIIKKYPKQYLLSFDSLNDLEIYGRSVVFEKTEHIKKLYREINAIYEKFQTIGLKPPTLTFETLNTIKPHLQGYLTKIQPNLSQIADEIKRNIFIENINQIIAIIDEIENSKTLENKFLAEIKKYIPHFILFSSFDDKFPSEITFDEAAKNSLVKDLATISNLDIDLIKSGDMTRKTVHKQQLNVQLKKEYEKYWTQEDIAHLYVEWEGGKLFFFIKEENFFYPPKLRSKGKQWHLAFYVRVAARAQEDVQNVILIDEPGLYLHATAQKDVLKILEDSSADNPIIFSTHSPYLLEADKLNRIRLVFRAKKKGTIIENKIHKLSDKETLTPILTAIGLELSSSIADINKIKNVIVEGQSDCYYLQAFKKLLQLKDINFVFGGGAGNMPLVGTILNGWGCKIIYLFDNDQGRKDAEKNLTHDWFFSVDDLLTVSGKQGERIEDIFSNKDFKKYVLENENLDYTEKNSDYVKQHKVDKVLVAKFFLQRVEQDHVKLGEDSLSNTKQLFDIIKKRFKTALAVS